MNPYLAMALIALAAKAWATFRLKQHWNNSIESKVFLFLLVAAYLQTVCELSNYILLNVQPAHYGLLAMRGYYVFTTLSLIILPMSIGSLVTKRISVFFALSATVLCIAASYLFIFTDLIVAGFSRLEHSYTRIAGPYYWAFQTFALLSMLLSISFLGKSYYATKDEVTRAKSANLLIGFVPLFLTVVSIVFLMRLGIAINAAGLFPLLVSLYLIALAENITTNKVVDMRAYIPWSKKARIMREVLKPLKVVDLSPIDSKELAKKYEQKLIEHAVEIFHDRKEAAKWLNVSQAKISKLIGTRRTEKTTHDL